MMAVYNKYYQTRDYFGKSYPELLAYFDTFSRDTKIVDLGCGQGRDVLALSRMGFTVMGIDVSVVGIVQLNEVAHEENLSVSTEVMDYKSFTEISQYDIVLMNSMFHFYKKDLEEETLVLKKILTDLKVNGRLVLIVQESQSRIKTIKKIIRDMDISLSIELDKSIIYQEFNSRFYFVSILKSWFSIIHSFGFTFDIQL